MGLRARHVVDVGVGGGHTVSLYGAVDKQQRRVGERLLLLLVATAALQPLPRLIGAAEGARRHHRHARHRHGLWLVGVRSGHPAGTSVAQHVAPLRAQRLEDDHVEARRLAAAHQVAAVSRPEREAEVELAEAEELAWRGRAGGAVVRYSRPGAPGSRGGGASP